MIEPAGITAYVLAFCQNHSRLQGCQELLTSKKFSTAIAADEQAYWDMLSSSKVEISLVFSEADVEVAFSIIGKLRDAGSIFRELPVIVIFPAGTPLELGLQSLQLGAYDYLVEPFEEIELLTKVTVLTKNKRAEDELRELAIRDSLTGLYDRRYLLMRFNEEVSRARRYSKPIACIAADVDNFLEVNTKYGRDAGDLLLQLIADVMSGKKREIDVLARKDSDEFVLVLYNTDIAGAQVLAERMLYKIREISCPFDPEYTPRISIGVAAIETSPTEVAHSLLLLQAAEDAMGKAKHEGGDRVVAFENRSE